MWSESSDHLLLDPAMSGLRVPQSESGSRMKVQKPRKAGQKLKLAAPVICKHLVTPAFKAPSGADRVRVELAGFGVSNAV
jgi:hypothetical protein